MGHSQDARPAKKKHDAASPHIDIRNRLVRDMTKVYTRVLSIRQAQSMRHLIWFLDRGLNVKLNIYNVAFDLIEHGQPGYGNLYRIRFVYNERH